MFYYGMILPSGQYLHKFKILKVGRRMPLFMALQERVPGIIILFQLLCRMRAGGFGVEWASSSIILPILLSICFVYPWSVNPCIGAGFLWHWYLHF